MGREDLRRPLLNCRNRPPQRPECSHRMPRCPGTTRGRCRKYANRVRWVSSYDEVILDPACGSGIFLVEAYKRLVLHWRSRNAWKRPNVTVLKRLLKKVWGTDLEEGAVELAAFSLCLALCDALEPESIRSSIKLFRIRPVKAALRSA